MSTKSQENVLERTKEKVAKPPMYNVILINDDYTPMEFVINVLEQVFQKSPIEAELITLQVHLQGKGLCGVYPKEVAEFKCNKVSLMAEKEEHPLLCVIEPESPTPKSGLKF